MSVMTLSPQMQRAAYVRRVGKFLGWDDADNEVYFIAGICLIANAGQEWVAFSYTFPLDLIQIK